MTDTIQSSHPIDKVVDSFGASQAIEVATGAGPWVSVAMPTHRGGPQTLSQAREWRRLLADLETDTLTEDERASLTMLSGLAEDEGFWQQQADGLVGFASPERHLVVRLSESVAPLPTAAALGTARLSWVVPWLGTDVEFRLVALSLGRTRVFVGTRDTMTEVSIPDLPGSVDDLLEDRDHQQHLQWAPQGGSDRTVHSHGADANADRVRAERFMRSVSSALRAEVPSTTPVVLACVRENAALFRTAGGHPGLIDEVVTGNADRAAASELHDAAWTLVRAAHDVGLDQEWDRLDGLLGTGRVLTDLAEIVQAAATDRVESLLIGHAEPGGSVLPEGLLDLAVVQTLRSSGRVTPVPTRTGFRALLRW